MQMMHTKLIVVVMAVAAVSAVGCGGRATGGALDMTGPRVFDVPRITGLVIDGKADDWGDGGFRIDVLAPAGAALKPTSDVDARARLTWNDEGLVVLVAVTDDAWVEHPNEEKLWRYDGIEVFLASRQGSKEMCQWILTPGMDGEHPQPRWRVHGYGKHNDLKSAPGMAKVARTAGSGGYIMELLLPWKTAGLKAVMGRELGFQLIVNDSDKMPDQPHQLSWFPSVHTARDSRQTHRIRLAAGRGRCVSVLAKGDYDLHRMRANVNVVARAESVGQAAAVVDGDVTLGSAELTADKSGWATATVRLPFPPLRKPYGPLGIKVADELVDVLSLPDSEGIRAEAFVRASPVAKRSVFSGEDLPSYDFQRPFHAEALVGPYELKTTYYDKDYNVVTKAATPGRYGAVIEITTEDGRKYRRFQTLFRTAKPVAWRGKDMALSVTLPAALGFAPAAVEAQSKAVAEFLKGALVWDTDHGDDPAVLLAGLYETAADATTSDFYANPMQRDRQWWVGFKRKFYGWDKKFSKPFARPRPIEGKPAPVLRRGTLREAGMKPDAREKIDALLTEWSNVSDEAFAVCVARHGVIVLHKAYGERYGKPMTVNTKSSMASTTKFLSGALIMMGVDQDLIDLDDTVDKYLPPLAGIKTNKPLTIRRLYTHTGGTDWHWGDFEPDMAERMAVLLPHLKIGARYQYNGTGMAMGCKILEAVSGKSLPNLFRDHLLGPLGCQNTDVSTASWDAQSVPLDIARICQMFLNKGAYGDKRFMSEKTLAKMLPQRLTKVLGPDTSVVYGIGCMWVEREVLGKGTFSHGAGSRAISWIDPVNDLVIIQTRNAKGDFMNKYENKFLEVIVESMAR